MIEKDDGDRYYRVCEGPVHRDEEEPRCCGWRIYDLRFYLCPRCHDMFQRLGGEEYYEERWFKEWCNCIRREERNELRQLRVVQRLRDAPAWYLYSRDSWLQREEKRKRDRDRYYEKKGLTEEQSERAGFKHWLKRLVSGELLITFWMALAEEALARVLRQPWRRQILEWWKKSRAGLMFQWITRRYGKNLDHLPETATRISDLSKVPDLVRHLQETGRLNT